MYKKYNSKKFDALTDLLERSDTLEIKTHTANLDYHETVKEVTVLKASDGEGHNMTEVRLRDQAFAALSMFRVRKTNPQKYAAEGEKAKKLFLSLMDMVSAEGEMAKIDGLILNGYEDNHVYMAKHENYPTIKWKITKETEKLHRDDGWTHKQDARQQLVAWLAEVIEGGLLFGDDLDEHHKTWLGKITNLVAALDYTKWLGAWSREELDAHRTSTMVCTIYALLGLQRLSNSEGFEFLKLQTEDRTDLINQWVKKANKTLLIECPDELENSAAARETDVALLYSLVFDTRGELADLLDDDGISRLLDVYEKVMKDLYDPVTWGIKRYKHDSYQKRLMYQLRKFLTQEGGLRQDDAFKDTHGYVHFMGRKWLVNALEIALGIESEEGGEAGWTHPHFQIASWAARRYAQLAEENPENETGAMKKLYTTATDAWNRWLGMATGHEYILKPNDDWYLDIKQVKPWILPEARIYHPGSEAGAVTPWPWLPLFWAVAAANEARAYMEQMIKIREERYGRRV